jgi:hypothetical protein
MLWCQVIHDLGRVETAVQLRELVRHCPTNGKAHVLPAFNVNFNVTR